MKTFLMTFFLICGDPVAISVWERGDPNPPSIILPKHVAQPKVEQALDLLVNSPKTATDTIELIPANAQDRVCGVKI